MPSPYTLSPQQFAAVSKLPGPDRYRHFVSRVADWQSVWGLRNEGGWVAAGDESGTPAFPVWPHPDYAAACALGEWSGNFPAAIEVHDFIDSWLPDMAAEGVLVAVFPTPMLRGAIVPAAQLQAHIHDELSRIE